MFKRMMAVILALALGACANAEDVGARSEPMAERIVGTNDLVNPRCLTAAEFEVADSVAKYVRGDTGKVCTGVLFTHTNKMVVSSECASATSTLGTVHFGTYPDNVRCRPQGATLTGDPYPVLVEQQSVDNLLTLMVVQLGPNASGQFPVQNHHLLKVGLRQDWPLTTMANNTDALLYVGQQTTYMLADPSCQKAAAFLGGISRTDCDSDPTPNGAFNGEPGFGGPVVFGASPTSPGSTPYRVLGLHYLANNSTPENKIVSWARLTNPGPVSPGFLAPFLMDGDYEP